MGFRILIAVILISFSTKSIAQIRQQQQKPPSAFSITQVDQLIKEGKTFTPAMLKQMGATDAEIEQLLGLQIINTPSETLPPKTSTFSVDSLKQAGVVEIPKASLPPSTTYGKEFFRKGNIKFFDRANDVRASDNYILAAGDEVSVAIWGFSDYNNVFTIEKDGYIQPRETGRIYLKGLSFKDARELMIKRFGSAFDLRNSSISINLNYSRVITVNVVGEVFNPGSYTVPAVNSAFNILILANGPNNIGTVRNIQVRRGGKTVRTLDLYDYLLNPDSNQDFFLEDNDYLFVPPAEKVISLTGMVKRPMDYELKGKEGIVAIMKYSGGISPGGYSKSVQVKRFEKNAVRLYDVDFDSLITHNSRFVLIDGDSVFVKPIPDVLENFVTIMGAVRVPGRYELRTGEKLLDLLNKAEGVMDQTLLTRAYLIRLKPDFSKEFVTIDLEDVLSNEKSRYNVELRKYDLLHVFSKYHFLDPDSITVMGSVRHPGAFLHATGLTVKDAIILAGGFTKDAANTRVEISRVFDDKGLLIEKGVSKVIVKILKVKDDLTFSEEEGNFMLQPYDQVFVRKIAQFELQQNVIIEGEVNYPGVYSMDNNHQNILSLMERAGGLTEYAFAQGAKLFRGQDSIGFLFLDLSSVIKNPMSNQNYILRAGDSLFIPRINELVKIEGAIRYPNIDSIGHINAPFVKGKRARYYISEFGVGFAQNAKKSKTYVIKPGGFVKETTSFGLFKIYPRVPSGSVIHAQLSEEKVAKKEKQRVPVDWNQVIERTTLKLTAVLTIWLLINNVKKSGT